MQSFTIFLALLQDYHDRIDQVWKKSENTYSN